VLAEHETKEVTLRRVLSQACIGKIDQTIGGEIKNRDRLMCLGLLGSVAVIEQSCVAAVRTQGNGCGKAVDAADSSGGGCIEDLAGRQVNLAAILILSVCDKECDNEDGSAATQQQLQACLPN